jgi:uncharacterized protein (TIGR02679 family)
VAVTVLDRAGLGRLWDVLAARLQRNGLRPQGTVRLQELDREERHALAGLLGRPIANDSVTVRLADLDQRLRSSGVAAGLVAAVEELRGPLVDRPGRRQARVEATARVWAAGRAALDELGLGTSLWAEPWFEDVRRSGALGRVPPERAERVLVTAARCAAALPHVGGDPPCGRGELASLLCGDAHGLDDGTLLGAVTLRAAAAIVGTTYPTSPSGRRALWREVGVLTDEVSTTALTAGLRTAGGKSWLDDRSDAMWESHLTMRDLRRLEFAAPPSELVFVCENPRVLEAAVDAGSRHALVCTMGQPAVVVTSLLKRLATTGAELRYHGDFDWPGIAIANLLIDTHHCVPWRLGAADYLAALTRFAPSIAELPPLGSVPAEACWDLELTEEMSRARRAIHEELVLDELLVDVARPAR